MVRKDLGKDLGQTSQGISPGGFSIPGLLPGYLDDLGRRQTYRPRLLPRSLPRSSKNNQTARHFISSISGCNYAFYYVSFVSSVYLLF